MTPYFEQDGITIFNADCRDVLPRLEPRSIDLILADPPYNVGKDYGGHDDQMTIDAYESWCADWFGMLLALEAKRTIIFPGHGNLATWLSIKRPSGIGCWHKPGNPASGGVFQWCEWEPFLLYGKGMGKSDVIRATVKKQRDTGDHPCPKPLDLMTEIVRRAKPQMVLDPFVGSGTTLVAARLLGVPAIGIELNERYCEIAANRLRQSVLPLVGMAAD